jgi:peptidoglycan biosynthesis protein MviN/MurJ (putative lipid II flippase)
MTFGHSSLYRRIALLSSATIVVGTAWILRDAVLVRVYGTSAELDHFMAVAIVATVITTLIASPLASTLVPEYMRRRETSAEEASSFYWGLCSLGIGLSLSIGIAATIALAASGLMSLSWLTTDLYRLGAYGLGIGVIAAAGAFGRLAAGVMNAHNRLFLQPVLLALPLIGPIAAALLIPELGEKGLFQGFLLGSLLQCAIASFAVSREIPIRASALLQSFRLLRPSFLLENAHLGTATTLMAISELALNSAAAAIGPGALSQLAISQRLPQLFQTFAGGVIATASYPAIADKFIKGDFRAGSRLTIVLATIATLGGVVAAGIISLFADPLTTLLAGKQMPTEGRRVIASMLLITAWQIPFAIAGTIMSRAVTAGNSSRLLSLGALLYLVAVSAAGATALGSHNVLWAAGARVIGYALSAVMALIWVLRRCR